MSSLKERANKILGRMNPKKDWGLEIGPLNNPLVKRPANVHYVDYATTEVLRQHPYDSSINPADIVDVDVVWGDQPLKECVPSGRQYDFAVACHVIEHVPDVIGWLHDLHSVLKPGGMLGLAVPDRRFTFDYSKHESTVGEMVEAYLFRYRKPSVRQLFDHCHLSVKLDAQTGWAGGPDLTHLEKFMGEGGLGLAYQQSLQAIEEGKYFDSHCWMFTPSSFLDRMSDLHKLGLFPFVIEFIEPSTYGSNEFIVRLTAAQDARSGEIASSIDRAKHIVADDPNEKRYNMVASDDRIAKLSKELGEERHRRMALEKSRVLRFTQGIRKALGLRYANLK